MLSKSKRWIQKVCLIALAASPACAVEPTQSQAQTQVTQFMVVIKDPGVIGWMVVISVIAYLFSVLFTLATMQIGYPPNMARLGAWLGACLWALLIAFVLFGRIATVHLPVWFLAALLITVMLFGILLLTTRRRSFA